MNNENKYIQYIYKLFYFSNIKDKHLNKIIHNNKGIVGQRIVEVKYYDNSVGQSQAMIEITITKLLKQNNINKTTPTSTSKLTRVHTLGIRRHMQLTGIHGIIIPNLLEKQRRHNLNWKEVNMVVNKAHKNIIRIRITTHD